MSHPHHSHSHDHDHGHHHHDHHAHPHTHGAHDSAHHDHQEHEHPPAQALLEAAAGHGKVLFFDAFSGLSGDMILAALFDLGVPMLVVERALAALPLEGYHLHRGHRHRSGIVATSFEVHLEGQHPLRTYAQIAAMIEASALQASVKALAQKIFLRLGEAEARVHRMPLAEVHFHEVGAVDSIVDIVGAAAALDYLDAELIVTPLPMGHGFIQAAHGVLPLPPPATVECLRGFPTYGVDVAAELVTPTGAAIVGACAQGFARWPELIPERIGFGAGARELSDRPNVLRVVLGQSTTRNASSETYVLVETNIDDMTGELTSYVLERLIEAGALDAWVTPNLMKKGRPGVTLSALAPWAQRELIAACMLKESTSIGVRYSAVERVERPREIVVVQTPYGPIKIKKSTGPFGEPQLKPEFDDCVEAAQRFQVSVREVLRVALLKVSNA